MRLLVWETESEKDFLANLGSFSKAKDNRAIDQTQRRKKLLLNYLSSIPNRKDWEEIDPKEILAYVDTLITKGG